MINFLSLRKVNSAQIIPNNLPSEESNKIKSSNTVTTAHSDSANDEQILSKIESLPIEMEPLSGTQNEDAQSVFPEFE
ncbi:MAG: hypothetical protein ACO3A4_13135, partial [Silvanigrellaceae bacterium]